MIKVFLPFRRSRNTFLDEIERYFNGTFTYGNLDEYNESFKIVYIHWPEALFEWQEPSKSRLQELKKYLDYWSLNSKIVYTRHNEYPHYKNSHLFEELYKYIEIKSDVIVHLGYFSYNHFKSIYPLKNHFVIEHPLYITPPNSISKREARDKIGISLKAKVILVFGSVRAREEKRMIMKSFSRIKIKNKVLLMPTPPIFHNKYIPKWGIKYIDYFIKKYYKLNNNFSFFNGFVKEEDLQNYFNAADVIFVARKHNLNSGVIFLGISFKKIVVGPKIGNIKEFLDMANFPSYNPNNINSIVNSLNQGIELSNSYLGERVYLDFIQKFHSEIIAQKIEQLFHSIIGANE